LDIETGEYEIDADARAALKKAQTKHPGAALYLLRIGYPTAFRLGRFKLANYRSPTPQWLV
jgi:hypothetical protein